MRPSSTAYFDTLQVAAALVYKVEHKGDLPRYVPVLGTCLVENLDLQLEEVYRDLVREQCHEVKTTIYKYLY